MKIMENKFSLDKSKKVFPIILMVIGLGIIYNLDKKTLAKMNAELETRHSAETTEE